MGQFANCLPRITSWASSLHRTRHKCNNKNGCYISRAHRGHPPLLLRVLRYKFDKQRSADKHPLHRSNGPCVSLQQSGQPQIQVCYCFRQRRAIGTRISFFASRGYEVNLGGETIFNLPLFFYVLESKCRYVQWHLYILLITNRCKKRCQAFSKISLMLHRTTTFS